MCSLVNKSISYYVYMCEKVIYHKPVVYVNQENDYVDWFERMIQKFG